MAQGWILFVLLVGIGYGLYRFIRREKPAQEAENDPGADGAPPDKPFPK